MTTGHIMWKWTFGYDAADPAGDVRIVAYRFHDTPEDDGSVAIELNAENGKEGAGYEVRLTRKQARELARFLLLITE
jgi:hypothetical protein